MVRKLEISHKTIIFTVFFLLGLWFLYNISDILIQIFVALVFVAILNPFVNKMASWKVPRIVSALSAYLLIIFFLGGVIFIISEPLVAQTKDFTASLPNYINELNIPQVFSDGVTGEIATQLSRLPSRVIGFGVSVFSNILTVFYVMTLTFYMLVSWNKLTKGLVTLFGEKKGNEIVDIISEIEMKLGSWARGQVMLMVAVGFTTYIGLLLLGVPFALPLALIAGMFEIIPVVGPFIAGFPVVIVGLSVSPITALAVVALLFLIQQVENSIFVPKIFEKSIGLTPVITLIALVIGFRTSGVIGALLSLPVTIVVQVLFKHYFLKKVNN